MQNIFLIWFQIFSFSPPPLPFLVSASIPPLPHSPPPHLECEAEGTPCKPGVVLPIWRPDGMTLGAGDKAARAVVYFAAMIFLFLGISIIADKFMSAIETITSQVTIQYKWQMRNEEWQMTNDK